MRRVVLRQVRNAFVACMLHRLTHERFVTALSRTVPVRIDGLFNMRGWHAGNDGCIEVFPGEAVNAMAILAACRQDRLRGGKARQHTAQPDQGRSGSA